MRSSNRRAAALLAAAAVAFGASLAVMRGRARAEGSPPSPYVLGPDEGEALRRGPTRIRVKADPTRGIKDLALGTQWLPKGAGIPVHQHLGSDEVLYVTEGAGIGIVEGKEVPIAKGSAVVIPRGAWHGVKNPDGELTILWIVSPPGLEKYFREMTAKEEAAEKAKAEK